jgi:hypothetical protein
VSIATLRLGACVALWLAATAASPAEPDPCAALDDPDTVMACYARRYCGEAAARNPDRDCYATVVRGLLSGTAPPEAAPEPETRKPRPTEIHARIAGIVPRAYGLRLFALDNAEVWEEIASSHARIAAGDAVRIVRGSFGSFRMFPERGGLLRVRQLPCGRTTNDDVLAKCAAANASAERESAGAAG